MQSTIFSARVFLLAASTLILAACSSSAPTHQGGGAVIEERRFEAMIGSGRLELGDQSLHLASMPGESREPYVPGTMIAGLFSPSGEIVGKLGLPEGRRGLVAGWLELHTRSFYPETSSRSPRAPFIRGAKERESGTFFPTAAIVHGESKPRKP